MFLGKRSRMVAVKDHDDDNQSNGVGKGKLRVLGAFRNPSMAMVALAALSVSSLNLISIAARSKVGLKPYHKVQVDEPHQCLSPPKKRQSPLD